MQIGRILIERAALTEQDLARALAEQKASGHSQRIGTLLVRRGVVSEATLYAALSTQLSMPLWMRLEQPQIAQQAAATLERGDALPEPLARRWDAFVIVPGDGDTLTAVSRDPLQAELQEHIRLRFPRRKAQWMLATGQDIEAGLAAVYSQAQADAATAYLGGSLDLRQLAEDAPIVEFVASMLAKGTDLGASDIHVEPTDSGFDVRYRVDGVLRHAESHPRSKFDAVISRLKLIAGLDIAERRLPQDGRFSTRAAGIETEVRTSVIPGVHGESVVLRLLPKTETRRFRLDALGLEPDHRQQLEHWLQFPDGIILVTGPTGSGKSTSLYAALAATDTRQARVLTVEDPVEYQLPGITQFQVQPEIGFTFPAALRAILRHDPDTIMIGEIRDAETARIAIQASLTGHKVLSTLHTNDAASAFVRLVDIGVEPFLLSASVRGVIAQRLIRRLCPHCSTAQAQAELPGKLLAAATSQGLSLADFAGRTAVGCEHCSHTGYRGRTGVHEFLSANAALRQHLSTEPVSHRSVRQRAGEGFRPLQHDALRKFWRGETSLSEVLSLPSPEAQEDALE